MACSFTARRIPTGLSYWAWSLIPSRFVAVNFGRCTHAASRTQYQGLYIHQVIFQKDNVPGNTQCSDTSEIDCMGTPVPKSLVKEAPRHLDTPISLGIWAPFSEMGTLSLAMRMANLSSVQARGEGVLRGWPLCQISQLGYSLLFVTQDVHVYS